MIPSLPARGRLAAVAALALMLLGGLLAPAANADAVALATPTGGIAPTPAAPAQPEAPVGRAALAPDQRTAIPPAEAPDVVAKAIAAANRITRKPYRWGGGHGRWEDAGYDCSGTVSYVLYHAGLLDAARDSAGLMRFGERGAGRWITVYAHGDHAYMVIAGLRFDTAGRGEEGPRWRPEPGSAAGYTVRHPDRL